MSERLTDEQVARWADMNVSWQGPEACAAVKLAREVQERRAAEARHCDGCWQYASAPGALFGRCGLAESGDGAMSVGAGVLHVKPNHYCAAWAARPSHEG